jgi:hypothetical protein
MVSAAVLRVASERARGRREISAAVEVPCDVLSFHLSRVFFTNF